MLIDDPVSNGLRSWAFDHSLVRFIVYRYRRTFAIQVVQASISAEQKTRPDVVYKELFTCLTATLEEDNRLPVLYSPAGEVLEVPEPLKHGFSIMIRASRCLNCDRDEHQHAKNIPPVNIRALLNRREEIQPRAATEDLAVTAPAEKVLPDEGASLPSKKSRKRRQTSTVTYPAVTAAAAV